MAFAASAPAATNEITTFKALAEFRSGGAAGNPARFTGTVLCFDSDWSQLFIQDSTPGLDISTPKSCHRRRVCKRAQGLKSPARRFFCKVMFR
jgi:hypothetical protein